MTVKTTDAVVFLGNTLLLFVIALQYETYSMSIFGPDAPINGTTLLA